MSQTYSPRPRILYIVREPWPTFRSDVAILFGKYLRRKGIYCDLVTERAECADSDDGQWAAGTVFFWNGSRNRALYHLGKVFHTTRILLATRRSGYSAIQVRDMPFHGLLALLFARVRGCAFFYWMSFPMPESHVVRARARGWRAGIKFWFPLLQGLIGQWVLYKVVLPRATHVFVQSHRMKEDLVHLGISEESLTPVPMGVDLEDPLLGQISSYSDTRFAGKKVLVYLGTLDSERHIEQLFDTLSIVVRIEPRTVLLIVGDTNDAAHLKALRKHAEQCGVTEHVVWTGWVPKDKAWRYVSSADIGISPFPRGPLLDSASPTKAVEYMALGLPVVVNDNPDQERLVRESGAGYCVEYNPEAFSAAILNLLGNPGLRSRMAALGQCYIRENRSYLRISTMLANKYKSVLSEYELR